MKTTLTAAALGATMLTSAVQAQDTIEMTSSFGSNLPILGTAALDFVAKINSISSDVQTKLDNAPGITHLASTRNACCEPR